MTTGSVWRLLLEFSLPMAIGLLFQQLYNTVDTIVVGRFVGKEALAAVGGTSSIINMLVGLCAGLSTGASVVISQRFGAHDNEKLRAAVQTTILMTLILSVLATGAGLLIVDPMLRLMAIPADVYGQAKEYLTIYFLGVSGLLIYNMGSGVLRAVGDSKRPLYFLLFSAVINVFFDLLFVLRFHMGIAGVAYATILSQFLSALLVLFVLTYTDAPYGIRWKKLTLQKDMLKSILSIGFPSGVQQGITSFSNVFVQSYINAFGSACMAGWSCYNKLDIYLLIPVQSIALAATTFVGQNYGAGRLDRAREGCRKALIMSVLVTAVLSVVMILAGKWMVMLFTSDMEVIAYGQRFINLIAPFFAFICFNQVFASALRGVGDGRTPMLIMLFSYVAFRQVYLLVNRYLGGAFVPVALAYPMGWVVCGLLMTVAYYRSAVHRAAPKIPPEETA